MPTLHSVAIDFHELLQDCSCATETSSSKARRIMKMTIYVIFVFVVRVLWAKNRRAESASKVFNVKFLYEKKSIITGAAAIKESPAHC